MADSASMAAQNVAASNLARVRTLDMAKAAAAKAAAADAGTQQGANVGATAGTTQAAAGAAQVQDVAAAPAQTQQAEAFNAPMLKLGAHPSLRGTIAALAVAMADPAVNQSSAQLLKQFHDQLFEMHKESVAQWTTRRVS